MPNPILTAKNLDKRFGGLHVTRAVDLDVSAGEVHALIGPNGAGKTTLVNQLCGELRPDAGRVLFEGQDVTSLPVSSRVHLGFGRTFQIASVFSELSVQQNVVMALRAKNRESLEFWESAAKSHTYSAQAVDVLKNVGLEERAFDSVRSLSYGERRQLEVAMALASKPRLLFLDEPMAGMGREDAVRLLKFLATIKGQLAMLLIEHDMAAVFALADTVTVLVEGAVAMSGTPDEVRADPAVRKAYLGESAVTF